MTATAVKSRRARPDRAAGNTAIGTAQCKAPASVTVLLVQGQPEGGGRPGRLFKCKSIHHDDAMIVSPGRAGPWAGPSGHESRYYGTVVLVHPGCVLADRCTTVAT
jgi:hypothetical protein